MTDEWTPVTAAASMSRQGAVFSEAIMLFRDRNEKYRDLWKQYTPEDHALHIKSKAMRVVQTLRSADGIDVLESVALEAYRERIEEDAIDLINYAAFLIRSVRGERGNGS